MLESDPISHQWPALRDRFCVIWNSTTSVFVPSFGKLYPWCRFILWMTALRPSANFYSSVIGQICSFQLCRSLQSHHNGDPQNSHWRLEKDRQKPSADYGKLLGRCFEMKLFVGKAIMMGEMLYDRSSPLPHSVDLRFPLFQTVSSQNDRSLTSPGNGNTILTSVNFHGIVKTYASATC